MFAVLAAMAVVVLDAGLVTVALPTLSQELQVVPAQAVRVTTAYQAGLVMALLPCGALGEHFGHRRIFAAGLALFCLAAAGAASAATLPWLLAARLLQGLGGAGVMALGVALLRHSVPRHRLGAAIGWNALTVALASAAAPSLGAALLSMAPWPWMFAGPLPLAALALTASIALPDNPRTSVAPDPVSLLLSAALFGLLVLAAEVATGSPCASAALLGLGLVAAGGVIRREAAKVRPVIPLDLLQTASLRLSAIASVFCFAGQTAGLVALPFYLQHQLHQSAPAAGLYMTSWPVAVAAGAALAGRLSDRVSTAKLCAAGSLLLAAGLAGAASHPGDGGPLLLLPWLLACGAGFGLFQTPNNRNIFLSAPAERSGAAGGVQGTARVSGQAAGAAMIATVFSIATPEAAPTAGLALGAVLVLGAAVASLSRARQGGAR